MHEIKFTFVSSAGWFELSSRSSSLPRHRTGCIVHKSPGILVTDENKMFNFCLREGHVAVAALITDVFAILLF